MNAQSQQIASRDENPILKLKANLSSAAEEFKMALPAHITPEKFQRTIVTAAQTNPTLLNADRQSFLVAAMKAAQDGLLPDGREAALVPFQTSQKDAQGKWIKVNQVQYMPMAYGLRKKILQSGEISNLQTGVVYRREFEQGAFLYEIGLANPIRHRPMLDLTDEEMSDENIVAAYSIATLKDGTISVEVMRRSEINKVRQQSQTGAVGRTVQFGQNKGQAIEPKGPWVDWFGEMARKTVMRRHSKTLPMSGDIVDVEASDERIAAASTQMVLASAQAHEPLRLPERDAEEAKSLAEELGDEIPNFDGETGEIVERSSPGMTEVDEETARQLDAETMARAAGETVQDIDGPIEDVDPREARYNATLQQIASAKNDKGLGHVEAEWLKHAAAYSDEITREVDGLISARRRALRGEG